MEASNHGRATLVTVLLVLSLVINGALAWRVRTLRRDVAYLRSDPLSKGKVLAPIAAKDLHGKNVSISFSVDASPTILYVFTPQCHWCLRNLRNIHALCDHVGKQYRVVGISLSADHLPDYVVEHALRFPIYTNLDSSTVSAYRLSATPETIVVARDGTILADWKGAYDDELKREVEKFFGVSLPGLT